jgi:hypothetical protein
MGKLVALTAIKHGDDDGKETWIDEGDEVKGLPKDVVTQLKEDGILVEASTLPDKASEENEDLSEENEGLKTENENLRQRLAELQKAKQDQAPPAPKKES